MKEKYLHYLWKNKLIPFYKLKLTDNRNFKVIYPGDYNHTASGPDFLGAKIEMDNLIHVGSVEIHIKSKDWYSHNHHFDPAYNTVVLHVVFEDNGPVFIHNNLIPTLELKDHFDFEHFKNFKNHFKLNHEIVCSKQLKSIPQIFLIKEQEKAIYQKLSRKENQINDFFSENSEKEILFHLLAQAMGAKVNKLPFEELATRLDFSSLKNIDPIQQVERIKIVSGLFNSENFVDQEVLHILHGSKIKMTPLTKVKKDAWKLGGVRPSNSPLIRVFQFAKIVSNCDFSIDFVYLSGRPLLKYFHALLSQHERELNQDDKTLKLSNDFKNHLIINCFVPFLFWFGGKNQNENIQFKAFELLELLPPEKNTIILKWKQAQVNPKNAYESQAMIEMYNELCSRKKCLLCEVGIKVLKPE